MYGGFLQGAAAASLLLMLAGTSGCSRKANRTPVILVSIDTLRPDHLGAYGYPRPTSPHLDAFARESIVFLNTFAHAPSTLASHASILTSLLPPHHGASIANRHALSREIPTLAALLKRAGWATASFNGGARLDRIWGLDRGFDIYHSVRLGDTSASALGETRDRFSHVIGLVHPWLVEHRQEPFFLFLHTYETHHPYNPDPADLAPFRGNYTGELPDQISVELLKEINDHRRLIGRQDREHIVATYDGEIRSMDRAFGTLVQVLRSLELYERSLIIFTSDHGEEFGEHGKVGQHAHTLYDELLRVPLIIKLPGERRGGSTVRTLTRGIDVAPTILAELGLESPRSFEGHDLLDPPVTDRPSACFSARDIAGHHKSQALRTLRWKLYGRRLFSLASDPREENDVASARPGIARSLRKRMSELLSQRPVPRTQKAHPDARLQERLRALGYVE